MRPKAEYWAIYDCIVVTDKRGSRSYSVEEANDLSDELRWAVREANDQTPVEARKSYISRSTVAAGSLDLPAGTYTIVVGTDEGER